MKDYMTESGILLSELTDFAYELADLNSYERMIPDRIELANYKDLVFPYNLYSVVFGRKWLKDITEDQIMGLKYSIELIGKEKIIDTLREYFAEGKTLNDISEKYSVSNSRARSMVNEGVKKLRRKLWMAYLVYGKNSFEKMYTSAKGSSKSQILSFVFNTEYHVNDAKIILDNLEGREEKCNPKGTRYFELILPKEFDLEAMRNMGFLVKAEYEGHYVKVKLEYGEHSKPEIKWMFNNKTIVISDENKLDKLLPFLYWNKANVTFVPRPYFKYDGGIGYVCYLASMDLIVEEDFKTEDLNYLPNV